MFWKCFENVNKVIAFIFIEKFHNIRSSFFKRRAIVFTVRCRKKDQSARILSNWVINSIVLLCQNKSLLILIVVSVAHLRFKHTKEMPYLLDD